MLRRLGCLEEAQASYVAAISEIKRLADAAPTVAAYQLELAAVRNDAGALYQRMDGLEAAERVHQDALEARAKLAASPEPFYQAGLAEGKLHLASLFQDTGRPREAEASIREASAIAAKLAADFPSVSDYRRLLFLAGEQMSELLLATGRFPEAEQTLRQAGPLLDTLAAEFPDLPWYREQTARHQHNLGMQLTHTARAAEAEKAFQQEMLLRDQLAAEFTEDAGLARELAYALANSPAAKLRRPKRAVEWAKRAADKNPTDAASLSVLGIARYRAGDWKDAVAALEQAEQLPGKCEGGLFVLAMACRQQGAMDRANAYYRQARSALNEHRPLSEEARTFATEAKGMLEGHK
jgi:tetratricopeptide (TPR) repeat protein